LRVKVCGNRAPDAVSSVHETTHVTFILFTAK
jgi:hypothetical protein